MGKRTELGMSVFHRKQGLFLWVYVNDMKMAGGKQDMAPTWKKWMKLVDLGEPTSFLDHVFLGCTQRQCKPNEIIIEEHRKMFESRISVGATEKSPGREKPHAETVAWSCDMEGHAKMRVERYIVSWQTKKQRSCTESQLLAWMIITSRRMNWNQLENCQKYAVRLS